MRRPLRIALAFAALHAILAAALAGPRLTAGLEDTDLYYRYASRTLSGEIPYRDFRVEYPPLALPLFLIPRLIAPGVERFKVAFAVEMLLIHAATVGLVALWIERREGSACVRPRMVWLTAVFAMLARLVVTRYDSAPALLALAAVIAWASDRAGRGGMLSALGGLMKVFPAVVAPAGAMRSGTGRLRGFGVFAISALVGVAAWWAVAGREGLLASWRYQAGRGFEYGSLWSGGQMLAAKLAGEEITVVRDRASFATVTRWTASLLPWAGAVQAAAILGAIALAMRRGGDVVRGSAAGVLAFVAAGKVFSPQYLIWLAPLMAVLEGRYARRARLLFAAICAGTLLAPALFAVVPRTDWRVVLAFNARNALVAWLLAKLSLYRREAGLGGMLTSS